MRDAMRFGAKMANRMTPGAILFQAGNTYARLWIEDQSHAAFRFCFTVAASWLLAFVACFLWNLVTRIRLAPSTEARP